MTDAMPSLNSPTTRTVADIEAELERIAQLQAHLSSVSSALQLELEQKLQVPGTTGTRRSDLSPRCCPLAFG